MCASANNSPTISEQNLIEVNLLRFVSLLRRRGLRISSAETLDALVALTHVDLKDREEVKAGLAGTLVKDADRMELFEQAFDNFFVTGAEKSQLAEKHRRRLNEQAAQMEKARAELQFQGENLDLGQEETLAYTKMSAEEQARLQQFLQQTSQGKKVDQKFKPIVESLVKGHIRRWENNKSFKALEIESTGDDYLDAVMAELMLSYSPEASLIHQDMGSVDSRDIPRMNQVIRRLSRKLATKVSRRYESSKKTQHVDIRRTIRANLRYGGIPIDLKFRQKRIRKPDLLLLCDVSGSMSRYATFTILFIAGLRSVVRKIQLFLFSEDLEKINITRNIGSDIEEFTHQLQRESKIWGEGTNLNRALARLLGEHPMAVGNNTVVIIISDTKTLYPQKTAKKLKRLSEKVKEIVWLNPMPREQWPKHQSVKIFQRHSKMYLCNTLAQMEAVFKHKLLD